MTARSKHILTAGAVAALALGGAAIAKATVGGDDERPIAGKALQRASAAALQRTGGGRVTGTEVGDEEGYYEVEVTRRDGTQVDVHLDRELNLIGRTADEDARGEDEASDDGPEDQDGPNDG